MSAGHTPGPWKVEETLYGSGRARRIYPEGRRHCLATIAGDPRSRDVNEANARLIAAAPELYEALDELVSECNADGFPTSSTVMRAQSALLKADATRAGRILTKARGEQA